MLYLGLDLTASPQRPAAYAVLDDGPNPAGLGLLHTNDDIIACARRVRPAIVAIDAPLFLPLGLCCLEESCPCQQRLPGKGRRAERALYREGFSVYPVTKRTFIKGLIYRGIGLAGALRAGGFEVIEVYPYASKVRLFGEGFPPKNSAPGRAFLRQAVLGLLPGLASDGRRLTHHDCDALLAAYTAYLCRRGLTEALGDPEEGVLHVPRWGVGLDSQRMNRWPRRPVLALKRHRAAATNR